MIGTPEADAESWGTQVEWVVDENALLERAGELVPAARSRIW